jgi:hypothetical protein
VKNAGAMLMGECWEIVARARVNITMICWRKGKTIHVHQNSNVEGLRRRTRMLNDDLIQTIRDWQGSGLGRETLADRIISLLDKKVQDAEWIIKKWDAMHRTWYEGLPTHEEVISGKAVKR